MILVYVPIVNARIQYTFKLLLNTILKLDFSLTTDPLFFEMHTGAKFSYGKEALGNELHFRAVNLLFEHNIVAQVIEKIDMGNELKFYKVDQGVMDFDCFACSFYLVSRYEEYLPHNKDQYGRYFSEESLACRSGFLERPMVNLWALQVKKLLKERFPSLLFPPLSFTFIPTIDIDNAYAYKYKGMVRTLLSFASLITKLDFKKLQRRIMVLTGKEKDPYDTYEKQRRIHEMYHVKPLYFILLGNYARYDKNLSHKHPKYIALIQELEKNAEVCLHPSYSSSDNEKQLSKEKKRLEHIIQRPVVKSRHHYIRIDLPNTYRRLIEEGFKEDYSMGYPDKVGYRASIATPFYFYDLGREQEMDLKIHPFVAMDVTLKKYLHIPSKDVIQYLKPIIDENKFVGGQFVFIFHNESMGGERMWRNWSDLYENLIKISVN